MRFMIQKGMDTKHAGTKSVASDMFERIYTPGGADKLYDFMQANSKQFDDILDFNQEIEKSVRIRLGDLPTNEIAEELNRFLENTGEALVNTSGKLDREALADWDIRDITRITIPRDFERNKKIHHCYEIIGRPGGSSGSGRDPN